MPIYVYRCADCGAETEKRQGYSEAPLTTCESCSGSLRRVLHPVGVIFKGSGFYSTDYKNGSKAKAADGAKDSGKSDTSASEGKSADTTASKSEGGKAEGSQSAGSEKSSSTTPAASGTKSE